MPDGANYNWSIMLSQWLKSAFRWGLIAVIAYVLLVPMRAAYWDAWQLKKTADRIAASSDGKMKMEVRNEFLTAIEGGRVKNITPENIDIAKNGSKWEVTADYEILRKLTPTLSLKFEFSISSERKKLWVDSDVAK